LYECNDTQIPIGKEVAYLENFIELEKLRQNKNVEITVQMSHKHFEHLGIAPFILMNFVENAFKHVSKHTDKPNWIKISLTVDNRELNFVVLNSASQTASISDVVNYGGIGLKNVQRRLDLLYPGNYNLDIQNSGTFFEVKLNLILSEILIPQPTQKHHNSAFVV
jgi:LytS/YehU family sensor histidine kinase